MQVRRRLAAVTCFSLRCRGKSLRSLHYNVAYLWPFAFALAPKLAYLDMEKGGWFGNGWEGRLSGLHPVDKVRGSGFKTSSQVIEREE
jgi:hypothetical protein